MTAGAVSQHPGARVRVVVCPTADVWDLAVDEEIKVGGEWKEIAGIKAVEGATTYKVASTNAIDDGKFTMIQLAKA